MNDEYEEAMDQDRVHYMTLARSYEQEAFELKQLITILQYEIERLDKVLERLGGSDRLSPIDYEQTAIANTGAELQARIDYARDHRRPQ